MTQFKKTINDVFNQENIEQIERADKSVGIMSNLYSVVVTENDIDTIRLALAIADKLMQEPTPEQKEAGRNAKSMLGFVTTIRNAMRDQLIKEVREELKYDQA